MIYLSKIKTNSTSSRIIYMLLQIMSSMLPNIDMLPCKIENVLFQKVYFQTTESSELRYHEVEKLTPISPIRLVSFPRPSNCGTVQTSMILIEIETGPCRKYPAWIKANETMWRTIPMSIVYWAGKELKDDSERAADLKGTRSEGIKDK